MRSVPLGTRTLSAIRAGYNYDNAGNRTSKTNYLNSTTEDYVYDAIYQLKQVMQGANTAESYSYDKVGNRQTSLDVASYAYNNSNQLTSADGTSFTYDRNGNTLTKTDTNGQTTYAWDYENRLATVTLPSGSVTFKYDPFGRRIQKNGSSGTTIYVYDGANGVEEVNASGGVTARFVQGAGIDEPLAQSNTALNYYSADGLGSITSLTDGTGSQSASFVYGAFGALSSSTGTTTNSYRYTAREYDQETGLYYYRARYYSPEIGRFISEDPIGFSGGSNFFLYGGNNPVRWLDPWGLYSCNSDGSVNPTGVPTSAADGAAAWAQDQYEKGSKDFTKDSKKGDCGGSGAWKCNCFVKHALTEGGKLPSSKLPKHYVNGKPGSQFATANELGNTSLNTSVLGNGDGDVGNIVAWPRMGDSGHTGIVGCDGKIYSATKDGIQRWNETTGFSLQQILRYLGRRDKVYRSLP